MKNIFFYLLRFDGYLIHFDFAYWHNEAMAYVVKISEEIFTSSRESSCTSGKKKHNFLQYKNISLNMEDYLVILCDSIDFKNNFRSHHLPLGVTGLQTYKIRMRQHSVGLMSSNSAHDRVLSVSKFFKQLQTAVK
jgi:hypothetical protein